MPSTTESPERPTPKIRDKEFARRLEIACKGNPHCPTDLHRGKQKWIYDGLEAKFGTKISSEAVRKWFAGESRPRPKVMSQLARLLEVDEAWLSIGVKPDLTPKEQKHRNAVADGAVNLVAGIIQMGGGSIAFPEDGSSNILSIIAGKQAFIDVVLPFGLGGKQHRLTIEDRLDNKHVVAVFTGNGFTYRLMHLTPEIVRSAGERRGDYWELILKERGRNFLAGPHHVRELKSIREIVLDAG